MKRVTGTIVVLAMALMLSIPMPGYARGGGGHFAGGHIGGFGGYRGGGHVVVRGGYGWGWWPWAVGGAIVGSTLASPYYYPPPPVVVQAPPTVYVQPEQQQADYWYYCQSPQGYYPYVKSCPGGWMKVVPDANPPNPEEGTAR